MLCFVIAAPFLASGATLTIPVLGGDKGPMVSGGASAPVASPELPAACVPSPERAPDSFYTDHGVTNNSLTDSEKAVITFEHILQNTAAECNLCHGNGQSWVFVLSTGGRTGSTSLMEMLNAIPGYDISGENFGAMNTLLDLYEKAKKTGFNERDDSFKHHMISEQHVLCAVQSYVKSMLNVPPSSFPQTIGFKEIRDTTPHVLSFYKKVFPCARFIVNYRKNIKKQTESAWHCDAKEAKLKTKTLLGWQKANRMISMALPVEEFNLLSFNRMLLWLGETGCSFLNVAHANDAKKGGYSNDEDAATMSGTCVRQPRHGSEAA